MQGFSAACELASVRLSGVRHSGEPHSLDRGRPAPSDLIPGDSVGKDSPCDLGVQFGAEQESE